MTDQEALLQATELCKRYQRGGGAFAARGARNTFAAVDRVSLRIAAGETFAIVGESGCGKTTLARMLLRLIEPDSGKIIFAGRELTALSSAELRRARRHLQMVFQDPYASLNPRMRVSQIVAEPLEIHEPALSRAERQERALAMLRRVGLNDEFATRYPHEFSGGQRQRIGIARALILRPRLVVADEPVSALDVSIQASILNLLRDLQRERDIAYLFISHDLAVIRQVADEIAVMHLGLIVEQGPAEAVCEQPAHPYTAALLSAVPVPDPLRKSARDRILLHGELPSATNPPSGCRFRTRCWKADERCATEEPPLLQIEGSHQVACHYPETQPATKGTRARDRLLCLARDRTCGRRAGPARLDRACPVRRPALPVRCHGHGGTQPGRSPGRVQPAPGPSRRGLGLARLPDRAGRRPGGRCVPGRAGAARAGRPARARSLRT